MYFKVWPKLLFYGMKYFWVTFKRHISPIVHCAPPRTIRVKKAYKLLLDGAKITETTWKWPRTSISKGAKTVRPPQKNSWDPLLIRSLTFWPVDGRPHSVSGSMHINGVTIYTKTHNHNSQSPFPHNRYF